MSSFADRLCESVHARMDECPGRIGFVAWQLDDRVAVSTGADEVFPAASTMKVLVMIAALRGVQNRSWGMDDELPLPDVRQRVGGTGVLRELVGLDGMSLRDLITLMIVVSDNVATNVLLGFMGLNVVNECAQQLGCVDTVIARRLMDRDAEQRGMNNLTTARDMATALHRLAMGEALNEQWSEYALNVLSRQQIRDRLPARLPAPVRCWNKTGEQAGLRHDIGLIGWDEPRVVVSVLMDDLADPISVGGYRGGPGCSFIAQLGTDVYRAMGGKATTL